MKKCIVCENDLSTDGVPSLFGTKCPACSADLGKAELCVTCQKPMPRGAKVCNECKSYKNRWLRYLFQGGATLTPLVALLAIISNIALVSSLLDQESHTRFKIASADSREIHLKVWNVGKKPSMLVTYRLTFEDAGIPPVDLSLSSDDQGAAKNVIEPGGMVTIGITAGNLNLQRQAARIRGRNVTLTIDIQESNDPGLFRVRHKWSDTVGWNVVEPFMEVK